MACLAAAGTLLLAGAAAGAGRAWTGGGVDGLWSDAVNWGGNAPAAADEAIFGALPGASATVRADATVKSICATGGGNAAVITIEGGSKLSVLNGGGLGFDAVTADITVNGPGTLIFSTAGGGNELDNGANANRTLTLNAKISGAFGFEAWRSAENIPAGTIVMGCETNDFTGGIRINAGHTMEVSKLANGSAVSSLGSGTTVSFSYNATLRYTGSGDSTDRTLLLDGGTAALGSGGRVEQAGSDTLTLAGHVRNNSGGAQTLTLLGDLPQAEGRVTGPIYNNNGTLAIAKEGSGTWVLAGSNTFTGGLTVNAGTLGLDTTNAAGNVSQIMVAAGAMLSVNPSGTAGFAASLPMLATAGDAAVTVANGSTVTFAGLAVKGRLALTTQGAGTPARIFITGMPVGIVGPWLTLDGTLAEYDGTDGLRQTSVTRETLNTKGNALPLGADVEAAITAAGSDADIWLEEDPAQVYSLTQETDEDSATVDLDGKTLVASEVAIAENAAALTIGAQPQDGALLPMAPGDSVIDNSEIAALNPVIWYDPSDAASTLVYGGAVTGLVNKGIGGAALDAWVRAGFSAPIFATGVESHSARPMLKLSVNKQGMESRAHCGISGNLARTLVAVMSRDAGRECIVSIGKAGNRLAFEPYLRNTLTRFGTYGGDIDVNVAEPPATPVIMTFLNGATNDLYAFQGFVNGAPTIVDRKDDLNTSSTPLHLGHRDGNESGEYRGQIGEVLLFAGTLSDNDRGKVEAYLIRKWKDAVPGATGEPSDGTLTLRNDSAAMLTVNAAVNEPFGSNVTLFKAGTGDVTLAGGVMASGATQIEAGTLLVNTPVGVNDTLGGAAFGTVSGAGALAKGGDGTLGLHYSAANSYAGGTVVTGGTLLVGNNLSLGTGAVTISGGGTLDIGGQPIANALTVTNRITVSGTGVGGAGAIVNNGVQQQNSFQNTVITLAGDTTFGGSARWDLRGTGATLDMAGHRLTKAESLFLCFSGGDIINAPSGTAFDVLPGGRLGIEATTVLSPYNSDPVIALADGSMLGMYGVLEPIHWGITPADGATITVYGTDTTTNKNVLTAGITLDGTLNLLAEGAFSKNLVGLLDGTGGLSISNGGALAMSLLSHDANTFSGPVSVNNAILGLRVPGSWPNADYNKLTLDTSIVAGVRVYPSLTGWTEGDIMGLAYSGKFANGNARLQLDVGAGETFGMTSAIGVPFLGRLDKMGAGTLALNGNVNVAANVGVYAGTLVLANNNTIFNLDTNGLFSSEGTREASTIIIGGNAKLVANDLGYKVGTLGVNIGAHNGKSVLDLTDDAEVIAMARLGGNDAADTAAAGAIYQSGNSRWINTGGHSNDSRIGRYGYGFWEISGNSELLLKGYTQLGCMKTLTNSVGILRQTGGLLTFNGGLIANPVPPTGAVTNSYEGTLGVSRGGNGILHFEGGRARIYGSIEMLDDSDNETTGGLAVMTVTGDADVLTDREVLLANRRDARAVLNLNGGTFTATHIRRLNQSGTAASVNFNGGTLRVVTNELGNAKLFLRDNAAMALPVYVYENGAVIDIAEDVGRIMDVPITRPIGLGVTAIDMSALGSGYIAPPFVSIAGGGGSNATAVASISRLNGTVTGIEITNPGEGYTSAPTVTFIGGGGSGATVGAITRSEAGAGGLTKTGVGTLVLAVPNAYWGPTRVNQGVLRLADAQAIPTRSEIIIGDGTLDLGGHTITNIRVTVTGTGGIVNGNVVAASVAKTGDDTTVWGAGLTLADVPSGIVPGLWEGVLKGNSTAYWNTNTPNPETSIQLTTRAGNGAIAANTSYAGGLWNGGYNVWVYTGYLWNRTNARVKWTWRFTFDDYVALRIDGNLVRNNTLGDGVQYADWELDPGPHTIDIRYGDGSGNVGPASGLGGLTYDPQGRGSSSALANFILLQDIGDGYLLTVNTGEVVRAESTLRVEQGTLLVPGHEAGLYEGFLHGAGQARNLATPNPSTAIRLGTVAAQTADASVWPTNTTGIYTGYIWNRGSGNATWTFAKNFDDTLDLYIDGTLRELSQNTWNTLGLATVTLTPGAHAFEARFGQGTGGGGPNISGWEGLGFGIDFTGNNTATRGLFVHAADPGDGSLFTTSMMSGDTNLLSGITVDVGMGATLDMGGIPRSGLTVTGVGNVINGGGGAVISPVGDSRTGPLTVDGLSLSGMTYRVTIHDPAPAPGLWEGNIKAPWDITTPNPGIGIVTQPTTRAGNGAITGNATYAGGLWAGSSNTWVYTGYLWNNETNSVKWTWRFTFDDYVALWLDGKLVRSNTLGDGIQYADYVLTPGPHPIEIRYGDGYGNVGPASGLGGLTYDPNGGGSSSALANFILLANSGDGKLLTTTLDTVGYLCDKITSAGTIDLTGLTIEPSDTASEAPPGSKYVIATAEGGFTGKPTVTGFTNKKWSVLKDGNELLLTTQGGTLLILK